MIDNLKVEIKKRELEMKRAQDKMKFQIKSLENENLNLKKTKGPFGVTSGISKPSK